MNGWANERVELAASLAYGASLTNQPVTKEYRISAGGALNCVLKVVASSTTVSTGITAKLQTALGSDWVDAKTVTISGNGAFYIKLQAAVAGDQAYLPLLNRGRVVLTTGAGDAVTIDSVDVLQEL